MMPSFHCSVDELATRRTITASASASPDYCEWNCGGYPGG